jgi:hypothetical protein
MSRLLLSFSEPQLLKLCRSVRILSISHQPPIDFHTDRVNDPKKLPINSTIFLLLASDTSSSWFR